MSEVLEKTVWSDSDFEKMGWHDATVYAVAVLREEYQIRIDLDYILKWVKPKPPSEYFTFWVAPATLSFHGVSNLETNVSFDILTSLTIQDIHREDPQTVESSDITDWLWKIELHQGHISFRARGYEQYFRSAPVHAQNSELGIESRGGLSFAQSNSGKAV